jgi:hypothetical protein
LNKFSFLINVLCFDDVLEQRFATIIVGRTPAERRTGREYIGNLKRTIRWRWLADYDNASS